ncbi:MAG: DUF58 domain-containing protein, partial [Thermoleophilia bacterium]|nr:DUF58 domain-containing protein [Thermoleophilia bacterium]
MTLPTARGYALLGLAVGTYLAGRIVGTWELYFLAFAFLACLVVSWLFVTVSGRRLQVRRSVRPRQPVAGDEAEFEFLVKNDGVFPCPEVTLSSPLGKLAARSLQVFLSGLAPRKERTLVTCWGPLPRGIHGLPPVQAIVTDPPGLFRRARASGSTLQLTVYPRLAFLDSCALFPEWGPQPHFSRLGPAAPGAEEFRGIRPHQPGEPLSRIDWKSTAKTRTLMKREMEDPGAADITLFLDGTAAAVQGVTPDTNFERAVQVAGSLADFALRRGHGVTLIRHEKSLHQIRLPAEARGRRELLETLAEAEPTAQAPPAGALRRLRAATPRLLHSPERLTLVTLS